MSYFLTSSEEGATTHPVFSVEVITTSGVYSSSANALQVYVTRERADIDARRLSLLVPNGHVFLNTLARVKACYKNGHRVNTFDFKDYYDNLTDEQYKNTQILCTETHKYL